MFNFMCDLRVLVRKLAGPFGHPYASLYASSTYVHLRLPAGPLESENKRLNNATGYKQ